MSKTHGKSVMGLVQDPMFLRFVNRQDSERTKKTYMGYAKVILRFSNTSGQAMLDAKKEWEETKLFEFKAWLTEQGYSPYYVESIIGCLRAFFRVFKCPLIIDRQDARKLAKRHRLEEDYYFKKLDMTSMYNCPTGTETEKYVVFVGTSLGLRAEDFAMVTYGQIKRALLDPEEPKFLGKINTEKEEVAAYPFLSHDAVEICKAVFARHPEAKDTDRVYDGVPEKLSAIVRNLASKSAVNFENKRLVFHCCRKTLYNALNARMGDKAKYIVGKAAAEKAYLDNDVSELRQGYRDAESIFSSNGNGNGETKKKVSLLEQELTEAKKKLQFYENLFAKFASVQKEQQPIVAPTRMGIDSAKGRFLKGESGTELNTEDLSTLKAFARALRETTPTE